MTDHRQQAANYAASAERLLADVNTDRFRVDQKNVVIGTLATALASLALYHQREADRDA